MHVHGLGLTTDLGLAGTSGRIVDRVDYLVVTMPDEPGFYFGNYLVLRTAPRTGDEVAYWTRKFADEIGVDPRIHHVTLRWDGVTGDAGDEAGLAAAGFTIDRHWVMIADEVTTPPPPHLEIRPLAVDEMAAVAELGYAIGDRHDEPYRQFLQRRAVAKQKLVERGLATWWGAFDDGALVGSLGIVPLVDVARYQDVQVAATHRKRGVASALLAMAARTHDRVVIVAEPDSAAARVYARAGFAIAERTASACRYPPV